MAKSIMECSFFSKSTKAFNVKSFNLEKLKNTHPRNVLELDNNSIFIAQCQYSYTTNKGNEKTDKKIFILNYSPAVSDVQAELTLWQEEFNAKYPFRAIKSCTVIGTPSIGSISELNSLIAVSEVEARDKARVIVNKVGNFPITILKATCQYTTNRNRVKTSEKVIPVITFNPQHKIESSLLQAKLSRGHKKVSNVQILDTVSLGLISL